MERDRAYARDELARLRARCEYLEEQLREMARRLDALENFTAQTIPPR